MQRGLWMMLLGLLVTGCNSSQPETAPDEGNQTASQQQDTTTKPGQTAQDQGGSNAASDAARPQAALVPEDATGEEDITNQVVLGDSQLTSGIVGEGQLSVEQIQEWLDQEQNHVALKIELPQGLKAGMSMIQGVTENPLTRAKIELGRQLYFERRLSSDGTVSCADCHHPDEGFARHTQFGIGVDQQKGGRNSPVAYNRILSGPQFWDGRAASLEEQAVGPIANPIEMANTHKAAVATLKDISGYKMQFEKIFEDGVTIDNVGRAIASFERVIVTGPSAYDLYEPLRQFQESFKDELEDLDALKEDDPDIYEEYQVVLKASATRPMSDSARRGRDLFFSQRVGCSACHLGANLADEKYHNLGIGMAAEKPDLGRFAVSKQDKDKGAFKTPTIRNVALSAPYMHDGSLATLEAVVDWYDKGGHPNPTLSDKIKKLNLKPEEKADLVSFMKACTGDFPKINRGGLPQ